MGNLTIGLILTTEATESTEGGELGNLCFLCLLWLFFKLSSLSVFSVVVYFKDAAQESKLEFREVVLKTDFNALP